MRRSANAKSFKDIYMTKNAEKFGPAVDPTFEDERRVAEDKAVAYENGRKAQASKFPNASVSTEEHPGYMEEVSDEPKLVEKASKFLKVELGKLVGRGGFTIEHEETRVIKGHKDTVDSSKITDTAMMAFNVKFELPGLNKSKIAKFAVSFDEKGDDRFKLEGKFLDANDKDYDLNSKNLEDFLNTENSVKIAKSEKPLVWFNHDVETFESVPTMESTEKVATRLKGAGYDIDPLYYVDACYDPKQFGRNCYLVKVPMNKEGEFKRIAAMSDDEWINRGLETERVAPYKVPQTEWPDRALEPSGKGGGDGYTAYDKKDYKKGDEWVNRTEDKGEKGNPYNTAEKMMRDESRKDAVKNAIASKPEVSSTLSKVEKLEKLLS